MKCCEYSPQSLFYNISMADKKCFKHMVYFYISVVVI